MNVIQRVYECVRYCILDIEYRLSPQGEVRGLTKFCLRGLMVLGVTLLSLGLALGGLSVLAGLLVVLTGQVVTIVENTLRAVGYAIVLGVAVMVLVAVVRRW